MTDLWGDPDREIDHPLMGETVRVCLDHDRTHWVDGALVRLTASGEVDLRGPDGRMIYAWPALAIERAD